jgi:hypothetical protein
MGLWRVDPTHAAVSTGLAPALVVMRNRSSIRYGVHGAAPRPDRAADRPGEAPGGGLPLDPELMEQVQVVRRRCTVCEWEAELIERGLGQDPLCPWCFGPTERAEILGVVVPEGTAGQKNASAASLGRLGGLKGGPARAQKLSAKRRREIASKAARARWAAQKKR